MHKYDSISCNELNNLNTSKKIWVKNISNYEPSEPEWSVLEKGLNYAMPNFKKDLPKFVSTVENISTNITGISEEERIILKHQISSSINCAQKQETISKEESTALKSLRANTDIMLVPADKGNMTVIMNTTDYKRKIEDHLEDPDTYTALDYDQIVSFIASPTYNIAKLISKLLMPSTDKAPQKLKNTYEAKEKLSSFIIPDSHILVSFAVKALFTSIPMNFAIECVKSFIEENNEIWTTTRLGIKELIEIIKLSFKANFFKYDGHVYKQLKGTPMGSPSSVVIAEIVMQNIEKSIFQSINHLFWFRYVDDIIACVSNILIACVRNILLPLVH